MAAQRRTRQEQREHNREQLLLAAERTFAERGIQGASLDDVAAAAGLTKGAVYSNFANKDDLIRQAMQRRTATPESQEISRIFADPDLTPEAKLRRLGDTWAHIMRSGERNAYARMSLEYFLYVLRDPEEQQRLLGLLRQDSGEPGYAAVLPADSELARLPQEYAHSIMIALDLGMAIRSLLDPKQSPPELYGFALQLLAGVHPDHAELPPAPQHSASDTGSAAGQE